MVNFESIKGSNTQVAFHPQPKGVIQFVVGFISGSFPQSSFRHLFHHLYQKGYSLVVYHFPFNPFQFNHWSVALEILKDLYKVRFEIIKQLFCSTASARQLDFYAQDTNYVWLGYSLGCKYILLLEILSDDQNEFQRRNKILSSCLTEEDWEKTQKELEKADSERNLARERSSELLRRAGQIEPFIKDQPSLLLAPEINNTVQVGNKHLALFSLWDFPSRSQIQCQSPKKQRTFKFNGINLL